jgi:hypothetical protein
MDDSDDEGGHETITLSESTLAALKDFALSSGIEYDEFDPINSIKDHFDVKERYDTFVYEFRSQYLSIELKLRGIKRELGQTLQSTGLTM